MRRFAFVVLAGVVAGVSSPTFAQAEQPILQMEPRPAAWQVFAFDRTGFYGDYGLTVGDVTVDPDTGAIVAAYDDSIVRIYDAEGLDRGLTYTDGSAWSVDVVPGTPDLLIGGSSGAFVYEIPTGFLMQTLHQVSSRLAVSPDGRYYATATGIPDFDVVVRNYANNRLVAVFSGHTGYIWAMSFVTINGTDYVLSASADGTVRRWDLATREAAGGLAGHVDGVQDFAVAPDGLTAISGGADRTVRLWNLVNGTAIATIETPNVIPAAVAAVQRGDRTFYVAGDNMGMLRVWELRDGQPAEVASLEVPDPAYEGLAGYETMTVAPDGRHIVAGQANGAITLLAIGDDGTPAVTATIVAVADRDYAVLLANGDFLASDDALRRLRLRDAAGSLSPLTDAYLAEHRLQSVNFWQ